MSNPFLGTMGGGTPTAMPGPIGGFFNFMGQFRQFASSFQGNPREEVQRLMQSGQMSQDQYNALNAQANQIMQMMGGGMGQRPQTQVQESQIRPGEGAESA